MCAESVGFCVHWGRASAACSGLLWESQVKHSGEKVIVAIALLLLTAGMIAAWATWGPRAVWAIAAGLVLVGGVPSLRACRRRRRWEDKLQVVTSLLLSVVFGVHVFASEAIPATVSFALVFVGFGCLWVALLGDRWRRVADKRSESRQGMGEGG